MLLILLTLMVVVITFLHRLGDEYVLIAAGLLFIGFCISQLLSQIDMLSKSEQDLTIKALLRNKELSKQLAFKISVKQLELDEAMFDLVRYSDELCKQMEIEMNARLDKEFIIMTNTLINQNLETLYTNFQELSFEDEKLLGVPAELNAFLTPIKDEILEGLSSNVENYDLIFKTVVSEDPTTVSLQTKDQELKSRRELFISRFNLKEDEVDEIITAYDKYRSTAIYPYPYNNILVNSNETEEEDNDSKN
jgi:hypothetical protein